MLLFFLRFISYFQGKKNIEQKQAHKLSLLSLMSFTRPRTSDRRRRRCGRSERKRRRERKKEREREKERQRERVLVYGGFHPKKAGQTCRRLFLRLAKVEREIIKKLFGSYLL